MAPLIVIAVIATVAVVAAKGRRAHMQSFLATAGAGDTGQGLSDAASSLDAKLREWEHAGLVRSEQIEAIESYEASHQPPRPSRLPLTSEAIGYLGGALVAAAVIIQVSQRWDELGFSARALVLAVPTVLLAVAGGMLGGRGGASFARLGSVLWLLGAVGIGGLATVVFVDGIHGGDPPDHGGVLFVGVTCLPFAVGAWWVRREPLQQLAAFAASVMTVFGIVDATTDFEGDGSLVIAGLAVYALGGLWLTLGLQGRLEPRMLAVLLGALAVIISPQTVAAGSEHAGLWLGLATVIGLVAIGAALGRVEVLLLGTLGLFMWLPQVSLRYLGDQLGTTATLLLIGVILLGVAASLGRLLPEARRRAASR